MPEHKAAEVVADVVDSTIDNIEELQDTVALANKVIRNNKLIVTGVSVISLAVGAGVATVIANKRFKTKYDRLLDEELEKTKQYYDQKYKVGVYSDPVTLAEQYEDAADEKVNPTPDSDMIKTAVEIIEKQEYTSYDKPATVLPVAEEPKDPVEEEVVEVTVTKRKNIFENRRPVDEPADEFDLDVELEKKAARKPYILEKEEFFDDVGNEEQLQWTFFEGDNALVDEEGSLVPDIEGTIGGANLKFGYGSDERNVVYIRNPRTTQQFEITRSNGSYAVEVLGLTERSLRHSDDRPRVRKFRDSD